MYQLLVCITCGLQAGRCLGSRAVSPEAAAVEARVQSGAGASTSGRSAEQLSPLPLAQKAGRSGGEDGCFRQPQTAGAPGLAAKQGNAEQHAQLAAGGAALQDSHSAALQTWEPSAAMGAAEAGQQVPSRSTPAVRQHSEAAVLQTTDPSAAVGAAEAGQQLPSRSTPATRQPLEAAVLQTQRPSAALGAAEASQQGLAPGTPSEAVRTLQLRWPCSNCLPMYRLLLLALRPYHLTGPPPLVPHPST